LQAEQFLHALQGVFPMQVAMIDGSMIGFLSNDDNSIVSNRIKNKSNIFMGRPVFLLRV